MEFVKARLDAPAKTLPRDAYCSERRSGIRARRLSLARTRRRDVRRFRLRHLGLDPAPFASDLAPLLARWNVGSLRVGAQIEYELACNWTLVFQNYSEYYHCPLVHIEGPVLGGYSDLGPGTSSLTHTGATHRPQLGGLSGADLARSYHYTIFPSLLLSSHADHVMVHFITPLTAAKTRVVCAWLFDPVTQAAPDFDPSDAVDFWDLTNRQDRHVNELTQLGVSSRAYTPGPYAESGRFTRRIRSALCARDDGRRQSATASVDATLRVRADAVANGDG